jgi:hypothetical protein
MKKILWKTDRDTGAGKQHFFQEEILKLKAYLFKLWKSSSLLYCSVPLYVVFFPYFMVALITFSKISYEVLRLNATMQYLWDFCDQYNTFMPKRNHQCMRNEFHTKK